MAALVWGQHARDRRRFELDKSWAINTVRIMDHGRRQGAGGGRR